MPCLVSTSGSPPGGAALPAAVVVVVGATCVPATAGPPVSDGQAPPECDRTRRGARVVMHHVSAQLEAYPQSKVATSASSPGKLHALHLFAGLPRRHDRMGAVLVLVAVRL